MADNTVHVYPSNDLIEHDTDGGPCACDPRIESVPRDDGTAGEVAVHNSADGREIHEPDFMPIVAGKPLDFDAWLAYGRAHSWVGPTVCVMHEGIPTSEAEDAEREEGDPCYHGLRLYPDVATREAVEANTL